MRGHIAVLLTVLIITACTNTPSQQQANKDKYLTKGPYVALVNNKPIYADDVQKELQLLPPQLKQLYQSPEGMESLVEELVKKELLYQEAMKRNYHKHYKFADTLEEFRKRLMIEFLLREEVEGKSTVTDAEAKKFYKNNLESFMRNAPNSNTTETIDYEIVADLIKERLSTEKQRATFESYVGSLKKATTIEINAEEISAAFSNSAATP